MPIVRVQMLQGRDQETKRSIAQEITDLLARRLSVDQQHIYVMFEDVRGADWAVAGRFLTAPPSDGLPG